MYYGQQPSGLNQLILFNTIPGITILLKAILSALPFPLPTQFIQPNPDDFYFCISVIVTQ